MLAGISRRLILKAAGSERVQGLVTRHGDLFAVWRFVAGESLDDCVRVIRSLNERGLKANTTILGEGVRSGEEADAIAAQYELVLRRFAEEGLHANLAVKLSALGIEVGEREAQRRLSRLLDVAASLGNTVRIDMEQSSLVDGTIRTYRQMREEGHENVGMVLQAYLYRSHGDLEDLLPLQPNLRIVKGAYLEPPSIAYPRKADVDGSYLQLVERALEGGAYVAVATHDERIIDWVKGYAARCGLPKRGRFEFQMLYGVRPSLQTQLVAEGYDVLVATPYGPLWYPYLMRRLAERPANLLFFLKNLVRR